MANVLGIIAEYNPFHNGHLYQLNKAKELSRANYVVAIMTGNFTQRGNTSIVNKWEKTKMALNSGIDMLIELPTLYSISSAENFADGAIKILNELNIVTHISFGMETDDIHTLNSIADVLTSEPKEYTKFLKDELENGISYPKARENAIAKCFNSNKFSEALNNPNNILGIEYLKAIKKQKMQVEAIGIKRKDAQYNSKNIIHEFASATAIRHLLLMKKQSQIAKVTPKSTIDNIMENVKNGTYVFDLIEFERIILYKIRTMSIDEIANVPDVSEGLENLIKSSANKTNSILELIELVKSKRYTQTRIQRILIYILLGITKKDIEMSKKVIPYIRVLGVNKKGKKILAHINDNNVITSVKNFENINTNKNYKRMLEIDKLATDIYTLGYKQDSKAGLDYTNKMVTL